MSLAVILAGHGSQISPQTAGLVRSYVDALRKQGVADEVTATFWKEQPEFSQVLKTVTSNTVVIVPLFTSSGYFVRQIIPAEMGLDGAITQKAARRIYLTRTIGEHSGITNVVRERIVDVLQSENLTKDNTSVAIIGHGTPRSNTTQQTTRHQVDTLRQEVIVAAVLEGYLDDEPDIPSIYTRTDSENIIAVPFFLAEGSHVSIDLPDALGIKYGDYPAMVNGRRVYYTPPIGTQDVILRFIIDLIEESGVSLQKGDTSEWSNFPKAGADSLLDALETEKYLTIGQLQINSTTVRPIDSTDAISLRNPSEIRAHIRENPFRPLASSDDIATNWCVPVEDLKQIPAIIETIYPGLLADWAANYHGGFVPDSFAAVMDRQQGMFQSLASIEHSTLTHHVSGVCGRCIKYPAWHQHDNQSNKAPCSTPCNLLLSHIKEAINEGQS